MASLIRRLTSRSESRDSPMPFQDWVNLFTFGGIGYQSHPSQTLVGAREEIGSDFKGYANGLVKSNGVLFACMAVRMLVFSEVRFQFQRLRSGHPGDLFSSPALQLLERPWWNGTTGDLLARMIQDADIAGNSYSVRRGDEIRRLRPDWMKILVGVPGDLEADSTAVDAQVLGYMYFPGGEHSGHDPQFLLREQVAHFAPYPDPTAKFRGMSWITPVLNELQGDLAAMRHKERFFEAGGTSNMVVKAPPKIQNMKAFTEWMDAFDAKYTGIDNLYKTMYLAEGADVQVVGGDMKQVDFKAVQGHGETRIAAAANVPPVIVGLSEGLEAATYSNYAQAVRRFADGTMRPMWHRAADSLATIIDVPSDARLWYDDTEVPFLQEDVKEAAEIQGLQTSQISQLVDAGYEPDAAVEAVTAGDMRRLKGKHTGLYSVQLQPPMPDGPAPSNNGSQPDPQPALNGANAGRALLEQYINGRTA